MRINAHRHLIEICASSDDVKGVLDDAHVRQFASRDEVQIRIVRPSLTKSLWLYARLNDAIKCQFKNIWPLSKTPPGRSFEIE